MWLAATTERKKIFKLSVFFPTIVITNCTRGRIYFLEKKFKYAFLQSHY